MRLAALTLILLAGCPAEPNVNAVYMPDGGQVGDVGDAGAAEPDAGDVEADDAGAPPADGEDEPEPPAPVPALEKTCGPRYDDAVCPTWVQGFDGELLCSPAGNCSVRCDVLRPCQPNGNTPPGELADAWRECQRKDAEDPTYKLVDELVASCASLGGHCALVNEWPNPRSWCVAD